MKATQQTPDAIAKSPIETIEEIGAGIQMKSVNQETWSDSAAARCFADSEIAEC